jgi:hypothetical protein
MACKVTGPHLPLFLPKGIRERMRMQETPSIIEELRRALRVGIAAINQELLCLIFDNFVSDLRQILANEAGHLQGVVYLKQ